MAVNVVECYDTETGQWETTNSTKTPRNGVGLAILNGSLYAIGGHDGQRFQNSVEVFDIRINRWKSIASLKHRRASAGMFYSDRSHAFKTVFGRHFALSKYIVLFEVQFSGIH